MIYYILLGNCFDVKLTIIRYARGISWSLGTCSSGQTYINNEEYIEQCCLDVGVYTLKCQDAYGDGWRGGSIEIQGTQYCEGFEGSGSGDGSEKSILVTIGTLNKHHFSQSLIGY